LVAKRHGTTIIPKRIKQQVISRTNNYGFYFKKSKTKDFVEVLFKEILTPQKKGLLALIFQTLSRK